MSETMQVLLQQVAERFDKNIDDISPEMTLESLEVDSLGKIELLFDLEDHFKVRIPNEAYKLITLQDVADLIDSVK